MTNSTRKKVQKITKLHVFTKNIKRKRLKPHKIVTKHQEKTENSPTKVQKMTKKMK